jgi:hypothetical protein
MKVDVGYYVLLVRTTLNLTGSFMLSNSFLGPGSIQQH